MTNPKHIQSALSALLLAAGLSMGCTPRAPSPMDNTKAAPDKSVTEEGGSSTKSDVSSGSDSK